MRTTAIIQARMGSSRLPGKILQEVEGRPLLWYVVRRVLAAARVEGLVVATTEDPRDDRVCDWLESEGVPWVRGSEDDVLDRYRVAARSSGADPIVRVTSDCPLIDPDVLDRAVELYEQGGVDYVSNTVQRTFPVGLDVEVFSRSALERAHAEARLASEREHVTPYIWKHPGRFPARQLVAERDLSWMRWVVDYPADLEFVRAVYHGLEGDPIAARMGDVLDLLERSSDLDPADRGVAVDEGYQRSLRADRELES